MQPHTRRLIRALQRSGLHVAFFGGVWTVRFTASEGPSAEILLPDVLPLEGDAVRQLADLAAVAHPDGPRRVCRACATPDFHPGDAGVAIGSVVETELAPQGMVIPAAVGTDINCGMRLHVVELSLDQFLAHKRAFVEKLTGDFLLGTRDVGMTASAMGSMFAEGLPAWAEQTRRRPLGRMAEVDW